MSYHTNPVATNLPRLGRRSIGAFGAAPSMPEPTVTRAQMIATQRATVSPAGLPTFDACVPFGMHPMYCAQVAKFPPIGQKYYLDCMKNRPSDVPVATQHVGCFADAGTLAKLTDDGASYYQVCLGARTPDVPFRTQHGACYTQAAQIPASAGGGGGGGGGAAVAPDAPATGMTTGKWLMVGGGVLAVAVAGFLILKPKHG